MDLDNEAADQIISLIDALINSNSGEIQTDSGISLYYNTTTDDYPIILDKPNEEEPIHYQIIEKYGEKYGEIKPPQPVKNMINEYPKVPENVGIIVTGSRFKNVKPKVKPAESPLARYIAILLEKIIEIADMFNEAIYQTIRYINKKN